MVKAKSGRIIRKATVPNVPRFEENALSAVAESDAPTNSPAAFLAPKNEPFSYAPEPILVVRITSAVKVHITKVSKKTSKMPQSPCFTGSRVSEAEWAITEEPSPASLEKTPRASPFLIICEKAKPPTPPATAFEENALVNIRRKVSGIAV